jgi:hypothetical protein
MSDYFHEQMVGKMKLEVTVPIDDNTTFPVKILTEGKAKEMVLQALEDVRAEINEEIEDKKEVSHLTLATKTYMSALVKCRQMIDRKIKEIKHERSDNRR